MAKSKKTAITETTKPVASSTKASRATQKNSKEPAKTRAKAPVEDEPQKTEPQRKKRKSVADVGAQKKNGQLYNVNTSLLLYYWDNGATETEMTYRREMLYITTRGNLFLDLVAGCGRTAYKALVPQTQEEATSWLKQHVPNSENYDFNALYNVSLTKTKSNICMFDFVYGLLDIMTPTTGLRVSQFIEKAVLEKLGFNDPHGLFSASDENIAALLSTTKRRYKPPVTPQNNKKNKQ